MKRAELDLWAVADAAGLAPKGRGGNFEFTCPDCQRKNKASGHRDRGVWNCKACGAKGNALTLARRFELAGAELPPRPAPAPVERGRGFTPSEALAAWRALEVEGEPYRDRLAAYLRDVRGFSPELADAGAKVSGVAWLPEGARDVPARVRGWVRRKGRPLVFALRDARGDVWTLSARWAGPGQPADNAPKALRLPQHERPAGELPPLAIFDSVPAAVAAALRGETIYLCEGAPDWWTAAAYCRIAGEGAALGAHDADQLPKVAAALRTALATAGADPAAFRVACVPHLGDTADKGERKMDEAAAVLAGAAAVWVVRLPVDAAGKADLADAARTVGSCDGVRTLRTLFARADLRYPAPVNVRDLAVAGHVKAALRAAIRAADGNALVVFKVPAGVGKSHAALELAGESAQRGRAVAYLCANHKLAAEQRAHLTDPERGPFAGRLAGPTRSLLAGPVGAAAVEFAGAPGRGPAIPSTEHARGMMNLCELVKRAELAGDGPRVAALKRAGAVLGRRMCAGCPLAESCAGWRVPIAEPGVVTFGAHDAAASLMREAEPADLMILDELPAAVGTVEVIGAHLKTLREGGIAAHRWRMEHPAHGDLAAILRAYAERAAADFRAEGKRHDRRLELADVLEALRRDPDALDAAAEVRREVVRDGLDPRPPMATPEDARRGAARLWPDAGAWELVRELARLICDPAAELHPDAGADLCLCLRATGADAFAFELRRIFKLPAVGCVLALDATAGESLPEWKALAAKAGRRLEVVTLPVPVAVTAPTPATLYRTGRLCTGRLWARTGRTLAFLAQAPGAVRNALLRAVAGQSAGVLGVLTHKPLADALRWGLALDADPFADVPEGAAFEAGDPFAREVADLAAELRRRGWTLEIGHFGRDERGTNAFERATVFAVVGPPRPDCGATNADARALGADLAAFGTARTLAATIQALARPRHVWRPGVRLFLAADFEDAPVSDALPGVLWTVEDADRSHAPTFEALDLAATVAELADRAGGLDVAAVAALDAIGRKRAESLCAGEAARRGWPAHRIGREGRRVYAPDRAAAESAQQNINEIRTVSPHGVGGSFVREGAEGPPPPLLDPMKGQRGGIIGDLLQTSPPDPETWPSVEDGPTGGAAAEPTPPATWTAARFGADGRRVEAFEGAPALRSWEDVRTSKAATFGPDDATAETFTDWPPELATGTG